MNQYQRRRVNIGGAGENQWIKDGPASSLRDGNVPSRLLAEEGEVA